MAKELNHFNTAGEAVMVDVGAKDATSRRAVATGRIVMRRETFEMVKNGTAGKGDVLGVARVAGIMATKRCADLIPLCHPLMLEKAEVAFFLLEDVPAIEARCNVQTSGKTGVEMEALCGVNVALLTIYDMCKAADRGMRMEDIHLLEKSGGQSGHYIYEAGKDGTGGE